MYVCMSVTSLHLKYTSCTLVYIPTSTCALSGEDSDKLGDPFIKRISLLYGRKIAVATSRVMHFSLFTTRPLITMHMSWSRQPYSCMTQPNLRSGHPNLSTTTL